MLLHAFSIADGFAEEKQVLVETEHFVPTEGCKNSQLPVEMAEFGVEPAKQQWLCGVLHGVKKKA